MKSFNHKALIAISALALGIGVNGSLKAADNATITATLTSLGALSAANVAGMNFGSWYFNGTAANPNDVVLTKSSTTGAVSKVENGTGTATQVVVNTTRAEQTVAIGGGGASEDGTIVNVKYDTLTNFADTDAVLGNIYYETANEGPTAMTATSNYPVTIALGGTAEHVYFGADITVAGAVTNGANTATFVVTYSY